MKSPMLFSIIMICPSLSEGQNKLLRVDFTKFSLKKQGIQNNQMANNEKPRVNSRANVFRFEKLENNSNNQV